MTSATLAVRLGLAAVAVVSGLWLGEHQHAPVPIRDLLVLLALAILGTCFLWSASRAAAALAGLGVALVFSASWLFGTHESKRAFNDCVQNGEHVRESLVSYRVIHGHFPADLAELNVGLPGELLLPPHSLSYRRTSTGYVMSFSDWLVNHEATELHGFAAQK